MWSDLLEKFGETLLFVLPESDLGKIAWLLIVGFFVLVHKGRFKLEWIGSATLYIWRRFIKCPLGKHSYRQAGIGHADLFRGGGITAHYKCRYCGKQDYFEGV